MGLVTIGVPSEVVSREVDSMYGRQKLADFQLKHPIAQNGDNKYPETFRAGGENADAIERAAKADSPLQLLVRRTFEKDEETGKSKDVYLVQKVADPKQTL